MKQTPSPGTSVIRNKGDIIEFTLLLSEHEECPGGAWVRASVGNAVIHRQEIIEHAESGMPALDRDWHDIPMRKVGKGRYVVSLPLLEVGRFEAKTFFLPEKSSEPRWPEGDNIIIKVEPAEYCCGNTIYTAFVRQFGPNKKLPTNAVRHSEIIGTLDAEGYAVIPKSGTFRDLIDELDFIIGKLGFRIIQLLPIHPVPTTYARMGRFGSPYAALDFKDVDPALAGFDMKTTPLDQFQELVDAIHARGARVFLDIPVNHTGWASKLQIEHPEWFHRDQDMKFVSPGAWGVIWADLAKLDYEHRKLWRYMAGVMLFWAKRGVDGFRCDAGYMLPSEAWKYITAKVRYQYPDIVFLLEGLGGKQEVVQSLLADANLDWAYSELFQNYDRAQVENCLSDSISVSSTKGLFVHYAETHDNNRLAASSRDYAKFRVSLSALCSMSGAFGITNGVEWCATEKVDVHEASSLNWGSSENLVEHIRRLNAILEVHPAFHSDAELRFVQRSNTNAIALLRKNPTAADALLVLANFNGYSSKICWHPRDFAGGAGVFVDLVTGRKVTVEECDGLLRCSLQAQEALCLSVLDDTVMIDEALNRSTVLPARSEWQSARAKVLEVITFFNKRVVLSEKDVRVKTEEFLNDPYSFCASVAGSDSACVITWSWPKDLKRVVMLPPGCLLCVNSPHPFFCEFEDEKKVLRHERSIRRHDAHFALFSPLSEPKRSQRITLSLTVFESEKCHHASGDILLLSDWSNALVKRKFAFEEVFERNVYALCVNEQGGMSQVRGAWGEIHTQYDALLAGNLNPEYPVDRRVMFTRCRVWMVFQGYSQAIDRACLDSFLTAANGDVIWRFIVSAGQGQKVPITIIMSMRSEKNSVRMKFLREKAPVTDGYMGNQKPVKLILRPDVEDRVNHEKTKAYQGAESAFINAVSKVEKGFCFSPYKNRELRVRVSKGTFVQEPEWKYAVSHAEDAERGLDGCSDLFSPGYFHFTLMGGEGVVLNADITTSVESAVSDCETDDVGDSRPEISMPLDKAMLEAMRCFIVKRGSLKTVIAGYPWFLDWGRDTLICLRGIIEAGMTKEARAILGQFGRFESRGTLPNMLCGDDDANRDTSDAPLWFCVACSDLLRKEGNNDFLKADCGGRTVHQVLLSIVGNYIAGTPNGVKMDPDSGLIFSPSHFTWMDTNYPAGTPREGYPIEIQALWHNALSLLAGLDTKERWCALAEKAGASIARYFVRHAAVKTGENGWLSDCLHIAKGGSAADATADDALRPNQLLAITLGAVGNSKLRYSILKACEELLIPGAIRSLGDRPVKIPLPIRNGGHLLNDPYNPYWGNYSGDEDTRRKPAYHNGTAWTWLFPSYSEALFMTYGKSSLKPALSILSGSSELINAGCVGHMPEVVDGDRPHKARGCGAQAWGATELYRVLVKLSKQFS